MATTAAGAGDTRSRGVTAGPIPRAHPNTIAPTHPTRCSLTSGIELQSLGAHLRQRCAVAGAHLAVAAGLCALLALVTAVLLNGVTSQRLLVALVALSSRKTG